MWGTQSRSWLRHCPTSRKVAGSVPDRVIGIFQSTSHYGPGVDSAFNRDECQEYFLGGKGGWCVGLTTSPPSCADCLEIWESLPPGILWASPSLQWDCFFLLYLLMAKSVSVVNCTFYRSVIVSSDSVGVCIIFMSCCAILKLQLNYVSKLEL